MREVVDAGDQVAWPGPGKRVEVDLIARRRSRFNGERLVYEPRGPLALRVEGIRLGDVPHPLGAPAPRRIVPDRSGHLIYYRFGAPGLLADQRVPAGTSGLVWVGPRSVFKDIEQRGRTLTLIVTLRPGAAADLLRHPVSEFSDAALPARDAFSGSVERLQDRLDAAESLGDLMPVVAEELGSLANGRQWDPLVQEAVRRLSSDRRPVRLRDLCRDLGVAERRFRERFVRQVGLSPKRFARITRVERVFRQLPLKPRRTWSRIAHEAGYADHPHLIREFNQLLGESPDRFARRLVGG